jgi:hypothetical protein
LYFDDFTGNLKKKPLPFLILFFGDSEGGLAEGHKLFRQAFQKANQDGTIQTLDGAQHGMTDVVSAAQTSQLFATGQLIVIHHAEKILGGHSESAVKQLVEYFENPNPSSYLLFLASGMKKNSKALQGRDGRREKRLGGTMFRDARLEIDQLGAGKSQDPGHRVDRRGSPGAHPEGRTGHGLVAERAGTPAHLSASQEIRFR